MLRLWTGDVKEACWLHCRERAGDSNPSKVGAAVPGGSGSGFGQGLAAGPACLMATQE